MNKEKILQMLKDNPIKIIKCGNIEIPVEYLKQTTVNVNGDDYIRLQQENQQLKKQLEEYKDKINWYENFEVNKTIDKLRLKHNVQQKKFINYLEDNWNTTQDIWYIKILQKYKEIIGGKENENND